MEEATQGGGWVGRKSVSRERCGEGKAGLEPADESGSHPILPPELRGPCAGRQHQESVTMVLLIILGPLPVNSVRLWEGVMGSPSGETVPGGALASADPGLGVREGLKPSKVPGVSDDKESACNTGDPGSISGSGRSPGEGKATTPVLLPGESHGQRSLAGCSPQGCRESDTTE